MVTTKRGHEITSRQPLGFGWLPFVSREVVVRSAVIAIVIGGLLSQSIAYRRVVHLEPGKSGAYKRLACTTES